LVGLCSQGDCWEGAQGTQRILVRFFLITGIAKLPLKIKNSLHYSSPFNI